MAINYCKCMAHNFTTGKKKIYAVAQYTTLVTLDDFARHIAAHNSIFDRATVQGVLTKATECIREMLLDGKKIQLGCLGDIYLTLHSETAEVSTDFTAANIKKVEVKLKPGEDLKNLISVAKFNLVDARTLRRGGVSYRNNQIDEANGIVSDTGGTSGGDTGGDDGGSLG